VFSKSRSQWTKAQWREVAETLAAPTAPAKRGRPRKPEDQEKPLNTAFVNYQALAHEVAERMTRDGLTNMRKTVELIMQESWQSNRAKVDGFNMRESRIQDKLKTTYTEVRKILAGRKSGA
jgi:hypothetical protein